jgi:tRNA G10  N-methylase Trm11
MSTMLFISGKNWMLSLSELTCYLEARDIPFEIEFFSGEFFVLSSQREIGASVIADLGGIIKIAEVKNRFPTETVKEAFLKKNKQTQLKIKEKLASSGLIEGIPEFPEKVRFGVSVYCTESTLRRSSMSIQRFVGSEVKKELAKVSRKSQFMGFANDRKLAQLSHVEVIKKNLVSNKSEVLFCIGRNETFIARTVAVHNPFEFQKRDIFKPNQRKIFGMPPRLARIMVNLSGCKAEKVLLDPFCGVGTILQEALLEKAMVVGMDVNPWCIKASTENLQWLVAEYGLVNADFRVVQGNVERLVDKIGQETVDCIVCEPDLGPALRQVPTGPYAEKIVEKLEPLYLGFVEQAYEVLKPKGRLVLVTPYIKTRSKQAATMQINKRVESVGFKTIHIFTQDVFSQIAGGLDNLLHAASLVEMDEHHIIGREIHILMK